MDDRTVVHLPRGTSAVMQRLSRWLLPVMHLSVCVKESMLFPAIRCMQIWECCSVAESIAFVLTCANVLMAIWIMLQGPGSAVWHHAPYVSITEGIFIPNTSADIRSQWPDRPDFALYTTGGSVIDELTVNVEERPSLLFNWVWDHSLFTRDFSWPGQGALMAGSCWSMQGSRGNLGVRLARRVLVDGVAIDHVPAQLMWDITDAPRRMEVWGLLASPADIERVTGLQGVPVRRSRSTYLRLAQFEYDIHSSLAVQSFAVDAHVQALGIAFDVVVLTILDNWGNQNRTCLYGFRVYGELATDASVAPGVAVRPGA